MAWDTGGGDHLGSGWVGSVGAWTGRGRGALGWSSWAGGGYARVGGRRGLAWSGLFYLSLLTFFVCVYIFYHNFIKNEKSLLLTYNFILFNFFLLAL